MTKKFQWVILKDMLKNFGYITLEAKDGIEAVEMVKKADFENIPFGFCSYGLEYAKIKWKRSY